MTHFAKFRVAVTAALALLTHAAAAQTGTPTWTKTGDPFAGNYGNQYTCIAAGANGTVYLAGVKGVYKTTNHGSTWVAMNNGLPAGITVTTIGFNSLGEPLCGGGYYHSTSGTAYGYLYRNGAWIKSAGMNATLKISEFTRDANGTIFACTAWNADVWRSTDNGLTYTRLIKALGGTNGVPSGALWHISTAPDGNTLYAGGELTSGIWRSLDHGLTWNIWALTDAQGYRRNLMLIAYNRLGEMIAGRQDSAGGYLQIQTATGWASAFSGIVLWSSPFFVVRAQSGSLYVSDYAKGIGHVYQSNTDGHSWRLADTGLNSMPTTALAIAPDGYLYVAVHGSGVYRTTSPAP